jgi:CRP/FNR family cyclic AMP-dependent transcriptional regulator
VDSTTTRFEPFPDESLLGDPAEYPPGAVLFRQGEPLRTLFYVVRGRVQLTVAQPGGRDVVLGIRHTGWLIGASAAVLGCRHWATGSVMETCVMRGISTEQFLRLNAANLAVAHWVQRILATDSRAQAVALAAFGGDSTARLGWYFADMARTASVRLPDGSMRLIDAPTQDALSHAIGISREHTGRLLQKFEAEKLIRRDKGRYIIPKGSALFDLLEEEN